MIDKIRKFVQSGLTNEALELISTELEKEYNLFDEKQERYYTELLALKSAARTLGGRPDGIILDHVRREKFPSEIRFDITDNKQIHLRFQNTFLIKCDAWVNSIHETKHFELSPTSASKFFVKNVDRSMITNALANKEIKRGKVIIFDHPNLRAPKSFHLILYHGNYKIDNQDIVNGIKKIFKLCETEKIKSIGFFAIGFEKVANAPENERSTIAQNLADITAKTMIQALRDLHNSVELNVYFGFVTTITMETFVKAFQRWTNKGPLYFQTTQEMVELERLFIDEMKTINTDYIGKLRNLFHVANEDSTILLTGETGVGKSFLAKQVHHVSDRRDKPFSSFNCAFLREGKNYTQLFGWKKGSFTDAKEDGIGLIEKSDGGTLFLDEIANLDIEGQKALLTYLDEGKYQRYGDSEEKTADVRLMFGTNKKLHEEVKADRFGHDLFERIAVRQYELTPLRHRKEDIPVFINWLFDSLNTEKKYAVKITESAINQLREISWPGNIRQLQHYLQNLYHDSIYDKSFMISQNEINANPPRSELYEEQGRFAGLENLLLSYLEKWDGLSGKFLDDFIKPILAKIHKEDLQGTVADADKVLGLSASSGKSSPFQKSYDKYVNVKNRFIES